MPLILSHRSACTIRLMDYVNSQVLQGLNFLQTAKGIVFLNFKEYCRHNLKSAEEDGPCRNGSNDDHPPFNRDNVLFNWPSNDNIMHLFLRDFDLKKELYSNSFNKIMSTPISTDHTFKVSKNIGFARKVEGKFVKQFENCSIALSDSGEVMTWCLTRLTALAEIKDFLSGLKQRLDRDNVQLAHVYVDDCCCVCEKYVCFWVCQSPPQSVSCMS